MDALKLADRLAAAERVTVLTGSGVSAASGIPTFRGAADRETRSGPAGALNGLWRNFRAEELASPAGFRRDPKTVWEWYDWRRGLIAAAAPNRAHAILAAWGRRFRRFVLITQNVDGLHERAGSDCIRLHGSIWELRCWRGCGQAPWEDHSVPLSPLPPRCRACGDLARPGVVWFGEMLPPEAWGAAAAACDCDVFLALGTSSQVQPAAGLVLEAKSRGAFTAEMNWEETPASRHFRVSLRGDLQAGLEELEARLNPSRDLL